jgi:quercetin dioxygenase-like cupin family protein
MEPCNWNSIEEERLNPQFSRRVIHTQNMTIARIKLEKSAVVPEHSHHHEQISMVEEGSIRFVVEGREHILRAGDTLTIPPHVKHQVEALEDTIATDVFCPVREDWINGADAYLRR